MVESPPNTSSYLMGGQKRRKRTILAGFVATATPPMTWKASTLSNLSYNKAILKTLRIYGSQLKEDSPGDNGESTQQTYRSGRILTSNHGRSFCNPGKSLPEKGRTYSAGAIPPQVSSRSKKHITYKEIPKAKPLI